MLALAEAVIWAFSEVLDMVAVILVVGPLLCILVPVGGTAPRGHADGGRSLPEQTARPIIGVLSMELSPAIQRVVGQHHSYIAASYVKFVEGAGAQVAPILVGQSPEYYQRMVDSVNGLLLPGGRSFFDGDAGYFAAARQLYELAVKANEAGARFPVLGLCLGMQLLPVVAAGQDFRGQCNSEEALPLVFVDGATRDSRLFARAPPDVVDILEKQNVTVNHHMFCITREHMEQHRDARTGAVLAQDWRTLAVNQDADGLEFISALEHKRLPLYGLQFHPEKNSYEWKASKGYPHSAAAVTAARYFADFLVAEARANGHRFPPGREREHLIYRHRPRDTEGRLMWEQLYLFADPAQGEQNSQTDVNRVWTQPRYGDQPRADV